MSEEQSDSRRERWKTLSLPGGATAEFWLERRGETVVSHTAFASPHGSGSGGGPTWFRCPQHGCLGEATASGKHCLAHSDKAARQSHFESLAKTGRTLSLRGHSVLQELWDEIVSSALFVNGGTRTAMSFDGAEISARIRLNGVRFESTLDFLGAELYEHIELRGCTFASGLSAKHMFENGGALNCPESTFLSDVDVSYTKADRVSTGFEKCRFQGSFTADGVDSGLLLSKSEFLADASFKHSKGVLILKECKFHGQLDLSHSGASILGERLIAQSSSRIGPCESPTMYFPNATFASRVHLSVATSQVDLSGAVLNEGGLLEVGGGRISLNQLRLGGPLRVSGGLPGTAAPEVTGLFNADAGRMSFARVDMTRCSFYGAHGLGAVDIEPTVAFPYSPRLPFKRRCIADEFSWRIANRHRRWSLDGVQVGPSDSAARTRGEKPKIQLPSLDSSQVAALYRELRRSLESKSDMPGAADFYYGEMEMRRQDTRSSLLDRTLITLYGLVSGYGLRPLRALVAWVLLIAFGGCLVSLGGFAEGDSSAARAFLFSARASLPGVSTVERLTMFGQTVETVLRILGPVLAALFLVALRARVMRKPSE